MQHTNTWVVVLAAGDGRRVRTLTRDHNGVSIPKQYWRFDGRRSLLQATLQRAGELARPTRIVPVVAARHRRWWRQELRGIPAENVIVQPQNRGTAAGILLPLLHIFRNDPGARLVVLPSDHAVGGEKVLVRALSESLREVARDADSLVLLGITPDDADAEYGWIVPRSTGTASVSAVGDFVEKPAASRALELYRQGALWNSFMFAASARTLVRLFALSEPELLWRFVDKLADSEPTDGESLASLYETLPERDFSRHVLQACVDRLRVLVVPSCGWLDVGTPSRLATWNRERAGADAGYAPAAGVVPQFAPS